MTSHSLPSNKLLGGRYKLIQQLGEGAFGRTFLAADLHLPDHPQCVVKQLKLRSGKGSSLETARRLFDTEARALYDLGSHDQIPRLLAHFEDGQQFYLAQELVVGDLLVKEMPQGKHWSEGRVINLLQDVLTVLAFVHDRQVIHRDIKPANLIRRHQDGKIVLIDFGAVKQTSLPPQISSSNHLRTIAIGTEGYMPNEQLGGSPRFSSDVYAVGITGIQALTGMLPSKLEEDAVTGELLWYPDGLRVSSDLIQLLDRMVRRDFRERYANASEALEALCSMPSQQQATVIPGEGGPAVTNLADLSLDLSVAPVAGATDRSAAAANSMLDMRALTVLTDEPQGAIAAAPPQDWPAVAVASGGADWAEVGSAGHSLLSSSGAGVGTGAASQPFSAQPDFAESADGYRATGSDRLMPIAHLTHVLQRVMQQVLRRPWLLWSTVGLSASMAIALPLVFPQPQRTLLYPNAQSLNQVLTPVAEQQMRQIVVEVAADPSIELQLADLLRQADRLRAASESQAALDLYYQAIALDPNVASAHWGRCAILNRLQQPLLALTACEEALSIQPDYPEALWGKGYALGQQRRYQEALALYDRAIALRSSFAPAWKDRAVALWHLQRRQEAIASLDRALQLRPDDPDILNLRRQYQ